MRDKLDTCLAQFTTESERDSFRKELNDAEEWIYGDGENEKKSAISKRLEALKSVGNRFGLRYTEAENRPSAINSLINACSAVQKVLESYAAGDDKYEHLTKEEIGKVESALKDKQQRLNAFMKVVDKMKPTDDPTVLAADLVNAKKVSASYLSAPPPLTFLEVM